MEYPVIVERKDGIWRAFIPVLSGLAGEGRSRDEALRNAQRAAENYLASVELTTISIHVPKEHSRPLGSPLALLKALEMFTGDEEVLRHHFDEIAAERVREREEAGLRDVE